MKMKNKIEQKNQKDKKTEKTEKKLREFDEKYGKIILGVDEAGRGPLAGPVVAGAVIISNYFLEDFSDLDFSEQDKFSKLDKINDSKKLTEKQREELYDVIIKNCIVGVGIASEKEIDEINILNATFLAMRRAINEVDNKLDVLKNKVINKDLLKNSNEILNTKIIKYDIVLVDGNHKIRGYNGEQEPIIKGDGKSLSIAAASIVAKVTRDRMLVDIAKKYPEYYFEKHKGYGTKLHREILLEKGPCKYHRKSFLKNILGEAKELKLF